jgi:hypothetical protein
MLPTSTQAQLSQGLNFSAPIAGLGPISFSPFPETLNLGVPGVNFGSIPVDEFNRALGQVISQDILHIEDLAKRVQDGMYARQHCFPA